MGRREIAGSRRRLIPALADGNGYGKLKWALRFRDFAKKAGFQTRQRLKNWPVWPPAFHELARFDANDDLDETTSKRIVIAGQAPGS